MKAILFAAAPNVFELLRTDTFNQELYSIINSLIKIKKNTEADSIVVSISDNGYTAKKMSDMIESNEYFLEFKDNFIFSGNFMKENFESWLWEYCNAHFLNSDEFNAITARARLFNHIKKLEGQGIDFKWLGFADDKFPELGDKMPMDKTNIPYNIFISNAHKTFAIEQTFLSTKRGHLGLAEGLSNYLMSQKVSIDENKEETNSYQKIIKINGTKK